MISKQEEVIAGPFRGRGGFRGGRRGFKPKQTGPRTNFRIRVPKVRVIASDGEQIGILDTKEAIRMAEDQGLDLVEISPNAEPPVCKIMDYGKYKYEQQKKEQESKKKQVVVQVKEIKLRPNTDIHDINFKLKHVRRFLEQKDKAKISIQFRGREMIHVDRAKENLNKIIDEVKDLGVPEREPKMEGRTLSVILQPVK